MFCKQSQAAEISYFVESIENQGNENNGTHTISANAPASSPPPGPSVSVSEDKRINFQNCIINIYLNLAVKFNLLKNTQPHYSYTPKSCLENDSYKLYFDRTILTYILSITDQTL
jgi:hypothetical protein